MLIFLPLRGMNPWLAAALRAGQGLRAEHERGRLVRAVDHHHRESSALTVAGPRRLVVPEPEVVEIDDWGPGEVREVGEVRQVRQVRQGWEVRQARRGREVREGWGTGGIRRERSLPQQKDGGKIPAHPW